MALRKSVTRMTDVEPITYLGSQYRGGFQTIIGSSPLRNLAAQMMSG